KVNEVVARMKQIRAEANQLLCNAHSPASPASAGTGFESFNGATYQNWFPTGWAFGDAPTQLNEWDPTEPAPRLTPPGVAHSGLLSPKLRGVLRSKIGRASC